MTRFPAKPRMAKQTCEAWRLPTQRIGRRVLVFDRLESTNDHAAGLANEPENDGVVVLAKEQSAGRGQHGRSWQCPAGSGILLSVLLFPPPALRRPALLTAWAAVSVCETILHATGLETTIKWPNDVLIKGRKVCGILIEQGKGTVAGIGLNVNQSAAALAKAGLPLAGSLTAFTEHRHECGELARLLIGQMDEAYERLCHGDVAGLEDCWKRRLGLLGRRVVIESLDGMRQGYLRTLAFDGLELEQASGKLYRTNPENVRHIESAEG
jgi:BirA family biotin operon repressor/biotin-[acetyl-CoA-carboxylase] ligase